MVINFMINSHCGIKIYFIYLNFFLNTSKYNFEKIIEILSNTSLKTYNKTINSKNKINTKNNL